MPRTETVYNVFISSPSDLKEEREFLKEKIESISLSTGIRFRAVLWEDDLPSTTTDDPQEEINKLLNECDILFGIFRGRFGSPTKRFDSGTVEEIEYNLEMGKPVILYFVNHQINLNSTTADEMQEFCKITQFKEKYRNKGIYRECDNLQTGIEKWLKKDLESNVKGIAEGAKDNNSKFSFVPVEKIAITKKAPWYTDQISVLINNVLNRKRLQYTYREDLTFYENLLLCYEGEKTSYPLTQETVMRMARAEAFNEKYGNYNYENDIRSRFPKWYIPICAIIKSNFRPDRKLKVLDVGGNYGLELDDIFTLDESSHQFTIVDISDEAIKKGKETYSNIEFVHRNMEESYLEEKPLFDVCLCLRTIGSRGVFRNAALIQMSKRIKAGGLLFVSIPNGYIDESGAIIRGLYDHRTKTFSEDRPITLARKVFIKMKDYDFIDVKIVSLDTEILVYGRKG